MSPPDIEPSAAPEAGPTPMRLGALLKQAGLVTDQTIEYALKIQKATNERVGHILRAGAVPDGKLRLAVAAPQNARVRAQIGRYSSLPIALQVAPLNKLRR